VFGVLGLVYMVIHDILSTRFFLIFSPIFIMYKVLSFRIFGLLLVAVEFKIAFVMDMFDFLGNMLGRGIFYI